MHDTTLHDTHQEYDTMTLDPATDSRDEQADESLAAETAEAIEAVIAASRIAHSGRSETFVSDMRQRSGE